MSGAKVPFALATRAPSPVQRLRARSSLLLAAPPRAAPQRRRLPRGAPMSDDFESVAERVAAAADMAALDAFNRCGPPAARAAR